MDRRALDAAPVPTVILRDRRIVYANPAASAMARAPAESLIGRLFDEFIAPEERERVADRQARRLRGEPVPADYEVTLAGPAGTRRVVQIYTAVHDADIVVQLLDVSDRIAQRSRLTALARLGAEVQKERSGEEVLRAVRRGLGAMGLHAFLLRRDGDGLRVEFGELETEEEAAFRAAAGRPPEELALAFSDLSRAVWRDGAAYTDDAALEAARLIGGPAGDRVRELALSGGRLRAVAVRIDIGGAPSSILLAIGKWPLEGDLPAFQLFGTQVAAAMDAARTIRDLSARNEELAALNRLAETAATAPDLPAFFRRGAEEVMRVLGCHGFAIWLLDEERGELQLAHEVGATPEVLAALPRFPVAGTLVGQVSTAGSPRLVQREDYPEATRKLLDTMGFVTHASVPLRVRGRPVGVMNAAFRDRRDARSARLGLLHAMAGPFAAAVEAQRLIGSLRGRVSALTLVNEVAVAAASLDTATLLENALQRILATLEADVGVAYLLEGGDMVSVAHRGVSDETFRELFRTPAEHGSARGAISRLEPVRMPRMAEGGERERLLHAREGLESSVAVPLAVKGRPLGSLVLARRTPRPFQDAEVALLAAVAAQLGVAVENARLFADTRRRVQDLEAVNALTLGVFGTPPGDTRALLDSASAEIGRALAAKAVVIFLLDPDGEALRIAAGWGSPLPPAEAAISTRSGSLAAEALRTQRPVQTVDSSSDPRSSMRGVAGAPPLSMLTVPLTSRRAPRGVVAVAAEAGRRFGEAEGALAFALASSAAVGLENARLYDDLRHSYAELGRTQAQLVQRERLAALGEIAAVVAHEVRNPLGVVFNSLGSLRRMLRPEGDAKMLLDIIGEEADRLNRIVGDLLDFARPSTPVLRPEALDRLLDEAVSAALAESTGGVAVQKEMEAGMPAVSMDARLVRQAVLNVAVNAAQAMQKGGTLTVRARIDGAFAHVELADTGPGVPEEIRHRIFEPFFTTKASGTGLGLAVVKRIVEGHRGEVAVSDAPGGGAVFTLRLPVEPSSPPGAPRTAVENRGRFR